MQLLEFQAKELLTRFGIVVPRGRISDDAEEARTIARRLGYARFVVKAQVQAGARREAGGVRFAASPDGVKATAALMLGQPLVTAQTRPAGEVVRWVLIEEAVEASQLLYVAVALDRVAGRLRLLAGAEGGESIEMRAAADPSFIAVEDIGFDRDGASRCDVAGLAARLALPEDTTKNLAALLSLLVRMAVTLDATLLEINPLAVLADGRLVALDAKMTIDDNALVRHPGLAALRAATQVEDGDPEELAADRHNLNYQRMPGDIGVVVNGAGLALATLDMLRDAGAAPANFMDIRTTASSLDVAYGFDLLLANPDVRAVLVNVHGGGMQRCDTVAEGVGIAMRRNPRSLPIVVRMAGNNADFARVRLDSYGVGYTAAADMREAIDLIRAATAAGGEVAR